MSLLAGALVVAINRRMTSLVTAWLSESSNNQRCQVHLIAVNKALAAIKGIQGTTDCSKQEPSKNQNEARLQGRDPFGQYK